jgi:hypothetical protein
VVAPEEVVWRHGWVENAQLEALVNSRYDQYLLRQLKKVFG